MVLFEQTGTFGIGFTTEQRYEHMKLNFALNSVYNEGKQRGKTTFFTKRTTGA